MMMFGMFGFLQALLLLIYGGQGPADLLDLIPTKDYWELKQVEPTPQSMLDQLQDPEALDPTPLLRKLADPSAAERDAATTALINMGPGVVPKLKTLQGGGPEFRLRVEGIIAEIEHRSSAANVRRLMAIRTLGELGDAAALPRLRQLQQSTTMFEADYARDALAAIAGEPSPAGELTPAVPPELLPAESWLLAQTARDPARRARLDWEQVTRLATAFEDEPGDFRAKAVAAVIDFAEQVGNARYDSLNVAASGNFEEEGMVQFVVRGQWDAEQVRRFFRSTGREDDGWEAIGAFEEVPAGQQPGFRPEDDEDFLLVPVDDETLVMAAGEAVDAEAVQSLLARMRAGQEAVDQPLNDRMAGLLKQTDPDATTWLAMYAPAWMMQNMPVKGVEGLVVNLGVSDEGAGEVAVKFLGDNPGALKSAMKLLKGQIDLARNEFDDEDELPPEMKQMMREMTLSIDDDTGTGVLQVTIPPAMMDIKFYADMQQKQAEEFRGMRQQRQQHGAVEVVPVDPEMPDAVDELEEAPAAEPATQPAG